MNKITLETISIIPASTAEEFDEVVNLFREYADSIGVDLKFQDFENEIKNIHQQYGRPSGLVLLVKSRDSYVGCAGIRRFSENIAELKRMYVRDVAKGIGLGKILLEQCLNTAKELGYTKIRLDTLPTMKTAQKLYRDYGFQEIEPYRFNPIEGSLFLEKTL